MHFEVAAQAVEGVHSVPVPGAVGEDLASELKRKVASLRALYNATLL